MWGEGKRVFVLGLNFPLSSYCVCGPLFLTLSGLCLPLSGSCEVKGGRLEVWGEGEGRLCCAGDNVLLPSQGARSSIPCFLCSISEVVRFGRCRGKGDRLWCGVRVKKSLYMT